MTHIPDEAVQAAEAQFTEYFLKNYPKDCIIYNPAWHAPKIFRAAKAAITENTPNLPASCAVEVPTKEERHANTSRNLIINQTSTDLEQIINGHDPEQSILNNDVWDRLDKMACEIEALAKPVDVASMLDQCAIVAECAFDDRPRDRVGHHSHMDWEDGFRDGTRASATAIRTLSAEPAHSGRKYKLGDRLTKTKGSKWTGRVVGFYSTNLTPIGYAIESETETGSVQIYPEAALTSAEPESGK